MGAVLLPIVGATPSTQFDLIGLAQVFLTAVALDERFELAHIVGRPVAEIAGFVLLVEAAAIVARRPQRRPFERPAATDQNRNARLLHRRRREGHLVDLIIVAVIAERLAAP